MCLLTNVPLSTAVVLRSDRIMCTLDIWQETEQHWTDGFCISSHHATRPEMKEQKKFEKWILWCVQAYIYICLWNALLHLDWEYILRLINSLTFHKFQLFTKIYKTVCFTTHHIHKSQAKIKKLQNQWFYPFHSQHQKSLKSLKI
jgi:hypothetical protein